MQVRKPSAKDGEHDIRSAVDVLVDNLEGARAMKTRANPLKSDMTTLYKVACSPPSIMAILAQKDYLNRFLAQLSADIDYDLRLLWARVSMHHTAEWVEWFHARVAKSSIIFYDNPGTQFHENVKATLTASPQLGILLLMENLTGEDMVRLGLKGRSGVSM